MVLTTLHLLLHILKCLALHIYLQNILKPSTEHFITDILLLLVSMTIRRP